MLLARSMKHKSLQSMIDGSSTIKPKSKRHRRPLTATLILTSLVDAFSILVIFLMMNTGNPQNDLEVSQTIILPEAEESLSILKAPIIRIEKGRYFLDKKEVAESQLKTVLEQAQKDLIDQGITPANSLMIMADKNMDYRDLNPIMLHAAQVGFSELKFAVMQKVSSR